MIWDIAIVELEMGKLFESRLRIIISGRTERLSLFGIYFIFTKGPSTIALPVPVHKEMSSTYEYRSPFPGY